jgi:ATP-dependent Clp protease ATP-binding subunit ClpX
MLVRSPHAIFDQLDKYVVGQDEAKRALSAAYFLHVVRSLAHKQSNTCYKKTPLLLYGPSGCGKTYLLDVLCKSVDMPYIRINAKDVTMSGYIGKDVQDVMIDYVKSYENTNMADDLPYGMIHIDEFDKICGVASDDNGRTGSWMVHQQQIWLSCIEGMEYHLTDIRNPVKEKFRKFPTHNLLIVVSGSFAQLQKQLDDEAATKKYHIGFGVNEDKSDQEKTIQEKFMGGGMIRELAGRFSLIAELTSLDREQLINIAKTPNSSFDQYNKLLNDIGVFLEDDLIESVVDSAIKAKTGARGLQAAIENKVVNKLFGIDYDFQPELNHPLKEIN